MKKVIVIVGPTGSGKTKRSIALAKKLNSEVINGDSVQIYKELNIGSAKITEEEKSGVMHHLFDIRNVGESYTAYDFQKDVREKISKINMPIIVGGTGFYIKSALYDYEFNDASHNVNKEFEDLETTELVENLLKLDPNIEIDFKNRVRVISALKQAMSGNRRSDKNRKDEPLYNILTIYLDYPRTELKEVLNKRLDIMFNQGLLEEASNLYNQGHDLNIIGYREINEYLKDEISLEEAKEKIVNVSMRLAKKQKTWFKNQMKSFMVNAKDINIDEMIYNEVKKFIGEDE